MYKADRAMRPETWRHVVQWQRYPSMGSSLLETWQEAESWPQRQDAFTKVVSLEAAAILVSQKCRYVFQGLTSIARVMEPVRY